VFVGKRHRSLHGLLVVPHWTKQYRESVEGNPNAFARLQGVEGGRHFVAFHDLLAILIVRGGAFSQMERPRLPPRMRQMADVPDAL